MRIKIQSILVLKYKYEILSRQGKTVEQTYNLVKASSSLAIIGQMDAADATTALTAAINGYAMSSDEAMGIVDKLTQLDLEFAAKLLVG